MLHIEMMLRITKSYFIDFSIIGILVLLILTVFSISFEGIRGIPMLVEDLPSMIMAPIYPGYLLKAPPVIAVVLLLLLASSTQTKKRWLRIITIFIGVAGWFLVSIFTLSAFGI